MNSGPLEDFLTNRCGFSNFIKMIILDEEYVLPDRTFLFSDAAQALNDWFWSLGVNNYEKDKNDCDDFAQLAASILRIWHKKTLKEKKALAFGWMIYTNRNFIKHCINFGVVCENNEYKIVFMEPQTKLQIYLTNEEKLSCELLVI